MERSATSVDDYLAALDDPRRDQLARLDALIRERMPAAARVLWTGVFWGGTDQEIIGYGDWSYSRSDGTPVEWFRVGAALQKNHVSVYLNATEDGQYLAKKYGAGLGRVKVGSAAVSFPSLDRIDLDELGRLVALAATAGDDGAV
ncbi:DUF1801 domain-containing protein [Microbacterium hominis]|uniref:DUF1801 domain-containing protein n=1 Tax=Microbacterium hominis TaxID=162426 RepID=A0A7D4UAH8_9MICO|nr:DUF1801 domain-containing protein [Microbacterium hominis]QKJ18483.1 DUF1801 domain-containing protein [Microbacterium hominis]